MPEINLTTNVNLKADDAKALVVELTKLGSELIGLPENYIGARYIYNEYQTFGGTFDPAFSLDILALDLTPDKNIKLSKGFFELLIERLGVSNVRGIMFTDPGSDFVGAVGTTVTEFKKTLDAQ